MVETISISTITTSLHTHCMVTSLTYNSSPPSQPVFIHTVWSHPPPTTLIHHHNQSSYTLYGHIPHLQLFSSITTRLHTHCMVTSPTYNSSPPSQPVFIHTVWSHPHLQLFSTITTSLHTHCMVTSPTYNSSPPSQPVFIHTVWSHPPPTTLLHHYNQSSYTLYGHIPHLQLLSTITTSLHTHCMVTSPTYNSSPPSQPVFIHTVWSHPPPTTLLHHHNQSSYTLYGHIPHPQLFSTITTSLHTHCMVTSPTYNSSPPSQPVFIHTVWSHPPPTTLLHHHNQSSYTLYGHIPHLQLLSTITTSLHAHCMVTSPTYNSSPPSQPVFIHTVWSHPPPTPLLHHHNQSSYTLYGHIPHLQLFSPITTSLHTHCMVTSPTYNSSPPSQPVFIQTVWSHPPPTTLIHHHNQSSYTLYGHIPHLQLFSNVTTSLHTHCMVTPHLQLLSTITTSLHTHCMDTSPTYNSHPPSQPVFIHTVWSPPTYNSSPPSQPVFMHTVWSHPPPTTLLLHHNQSSYTLYGHIPHLQLLSTITTSLHTHCMVTPPPTTLLHRHNQSSYTLYGNIPHLQLFSSITTSLHTHCMVTSPTYNSSPPSQPVFIHTVWSHPPPTPGGGGGVDPIPCVSTHRISDPHSGPAQLLPPHVKQCSYPHGVRPQIPDR